MHMISKMDLSDAEMDTLTKSCSPTIVITANGEVQTHEEATVYVTELDIFLTLKVAVLSLGKLCDENGYSYEWINGQKPHLIKTVFGYSAIRRTSFRSWFLVYQRVVPQALLSSTSMTPSRQEIDHTMSSSSSSTSPPMTSSTESCESVARQERGDPQLCQVNMLKGKNGETRALLKSQKSSC